MQSNEMIREREKILNKLSKKGIIYIWIGIVLVLWNSLLVVLSFETSEGEEAYITISVIIFFLAFVIWGVLLTKSGIQKRKGVKIFESYRLKLYGKEDALNINYRAIASHMGKDEPTAKKEVDLLIKLKLWEYVYGGRTAVKHNTMNTMTSQVSVTCNSCQGVTSININDLRARCDYCNAPLSDEMYQMRSK